MIQFEDILQEIVDSMDAVQINPNLSRIPKFYWGISNDLPAFLEVHKEDGFPLIWSVTKIDKEVPVGYERNAEICFCTRQTRDLLNTKRMEESYKTVLIPLWNAFSKKCQLYRGINIKKQSATFLKAPNYSVSKAKKQSPVLDIWDVYKVTFSATFKDKC